VLFTGLIFWLFFLAILALMAVNVSFIKSLRFQSILLLIASYIFYGYWDWRFLSLIILVSVQTYIFGNLIAKTLTRPKLYLGLSIAINLVILGFFKYFNFFGEEFLKAFGLRNSFSLTHIVLPVGISFFVFQSLTYVVDIYLKNLEPEKKAINYFTYIAFFPQLVAGPIERASSLLPQFRDIKGPTLATLYPGIKIIILGLFLKVFIADNLAPHVDYIFSNYKTLDGGTLLLGAGYFSIQIYGDFCGYSLIAIGVAKIMGFRLMRNFDTPYFATSIQEFWRKWHISLSTFFRDYVYIPLGGSRTSDIIIFRNLILTFFISGIWHGANWTFMAWGFFHGLFAALQRKISINMPTILKWVATMILVLFLWIFFRADSISDATHFIGKILADPGLPSERRIGVIFIVYYLIVDGLLWAFKEEGRTFFDRPIIEYIILSVMLVMSVGTIHAGNPNFIYFQF